MMNTTMTDRDAQGVEKLFSPVAVGAISLLHRVVHAPTTRLRAAEDHSPSAMMVEYYRQRASKGGLLITESVHPSYPRLRRGAGDLYRRSRQGLEDADRRGS
jgi:2,4-dienoyl-CoA reductase-like NADH-dependent reductase (Old Yellow Enzyme family)